MKCAAAAVVDNGAVVVEESIVVYISCAFQWDVIQPLISPRH